MSKHQSLLPVWGARNWPGRKQDQVSPLNCNDLEAPYQRTTSLVLQSEGLTSLCQQQAAIRVQHTPPGPGQWWPTLTHVTPLRGDGAMRGGTALPRAALPHLTRLQQQHLKLRDRFCGLEGLEALWLPSTVWRESPWSGSTAAGLQEMEA